MSSNVPTRHVLNWEKAKNSFNNFKNTRVKVTTVIGFFIVSEFINMIRSYEYKGEYKGKKGGEDKEELVPEYSNEQIEQHLNNLKNSKKKFRHYNSGDYVSEVLTWGNRNTEDSKEHLANFYYLRNFDQNLKKLNFVQHCIVLKTGLSVAKTKIIDESSPFVKSFFGRNQGEEY